MPTTLTLPDAFVVQVGPSGPTLGFNNAGDLSLSNPARKSSGRALVVGENDQLIINFESDFTKGVRIVGQVQLPHLAAAPAGTATDFIKVDAAGNLFRAP